MSSVLPVDRRLRREVLAMLALDDVPVAVQDAVLGQIERIALNRLAFIVPGLLSTDQLLEIETLYTDTMSDQAMTEWIRERLPLYDELVRAIVLDIAEEAAAR